MFLELFCGPGWEWGWGNYFFLEEAFSSLRESVFDSAPTPSQVNLVWNVYWLSSLHCFDWKIESKHHDRFQIEDARFKNKLKDDTGPSDHIQLWSHSSFAFRYWTWQFPVVHDSHEWFMKLGKWPKPCIVPGPLWAVPELELEEPSSSIMLPLVRQQTFHPCLTASSLPREVLTRWSLAGQLPAPQALLPSALCPESAQCPVPSAGLQQTLVLWSLAVAPSTSSLTALLELWMDVCLQVFWTCHSLFQHVTHPTLLPFHLHSHRNRTRVALESSVSSYPSPVSSSTQSRGLVDSM